MESIDSLSVLLATGISYRSLRAKNLYHFIGNGVSYGSPVLTQNYENKTVMVIGGANSAGQAAMYLSRCNNCKVILVVRGSTLIDKMSQYLCTRINNNSHIQVMYESEVIEVNGNITLETVNVITDGVIKTIDCNQIYVLIGAEPKTKWLSDLVKTDDNGFILASEDNCIPLQAHKGLFVAGDVRANSIKRVSNAVGEGARVINSIHKYLSTLGVS